MLLRLKPWTEDDRRKIIDICNSKNYKIENKKDEEGCVTIDLEDMKNNMIDRAQFKKDLHDKYVRYEIGKMPVTEGLGLLSELIGLSESKKKKCPCKKCDMTLSKEIGEKILKSKNIKESIESLWVEELNESGGHKHSKTSLHLWDDLEHPMVHKIAKSLGVHDHGHPVKLGSNLFATYLGGGLSFYHDLDDMPSDDE